MAAPDRQPWQRPPAPPYVFYGGRISLIERILESALTAYIWASLVCLAIIVCCPFLSLVIR